MRKQMITAIVAVAAFGLHAAAIGDDDDSRTEHAQSIPRIVGLWSKEVTLRNCVTGDVAPVVNPIFPSISTFHVGGTMSEHGSRFSPATRTTGQGIWNRTGRRTFASRAMWHVFDASGFFVGVFDVKSTMTLSRDGNAFSTKATFTITDPIGVVIATGCATETATRINL